MKKALNAVICVLVLTACGGMTPGQEIILKKTPPRTPDWIYKTPEDIRNYYFCGMSIHAPNIKIGKEQARADAAKQVSQFLGTTVTYEYEERYVQSAKQSEELVDRTLKEIADNIVYNLKEKETYIEQVKYADESGKTKIGYNVYTLFALPKKTYKEIVKNTIEENKASANPNAAKVLEELEKELLSEE